MNQRSAWCGRRVCAGPAGPGGTDAAHGRAPGLLHAGSARRVRRARRADAPRACNCEQVRALLLRCKLKVSRCRVLREGMRCAVFSCCLRPAHSRAACRRTPRSRASAASVQAPGRPRPCKCDQGGFEIVGIWCLGDPRTHHKACLHVCEPL